MRTRRKEGQKTRYILLVTCLHVHCALARGRRHRDGQHGGSRIILLSRSSFLQRQWYGPTLQPYHPAAIHRPAEGGRQGFPLQRYGDVRFTYAGTLTVMY